MSALLDAPLVWLVAVPAALALLAAMVPTRPRLLAPVLAGASALLTGAAALAALPSASGTTPVSAGEIPWFVSGERSLSLAWSIDSLTLVMLAVVGFVATCVVIFSVGYMHDEPGWSRYFALISLFVGSMNLLVIATSLTTLFMGWELVGACSYLLIGFWYQKPSAARAAIKAFVTTRVGDVGLLAGIALLWAQTGTDSYTEVFSSLGGISGVAVAGAAICIAIGAMGKSAQFPLHAWLPDAMEGPTPVSALIHAATMVAAGVFAIARLWPLFEAAPAAQTLLLVVGAISALGAALAATAQSDIKKVLAYSTISQLGFMFAALGAGAWAAAIFHLATHAAFKALLFLGSGSVIHGSGTQDLREMGGLRRTMPATFVTWMVGVTALAGVFPLSGFFSKDAVLESVLHASAPAGVALFAASALTAFYAARATRLAFFGEPAEKGAHESPLPMLAPLVALAVPAAAAGVAQSWVVESLGAHAEPLSLGVSAVALGLAIAGAVAGWLAAPATPAPGLQASVHGLLARGWGFDALVDTIVVRPVIGLARGVWAVGDRLLADGIPEGAAALSRRAGRGLSRLQTGDGQAYAAAIAVMFVVLLIASVWIGRW